VDHKIFEAEFRAQTDADKSVSFALRHANDTLAIMYYKLRRGVPPEDAEEGQMDSVLCSMESKFALQVGRFQATRVAASSAPLPRKSHQQPVTSMASRKFGE